MGEDDWNEILTDPRKTTLLAGDGSNRTYKRVRLEESNQSYIIMELQGKDKNLLEQDKYSWPIIAKTLAQKYIRFPKLHRVLKNRASLIIEDCGQTTLNELLTNPQTSQQLAPFYKEPLDIITKFLSYSNNPKDLWCQRRFDFELLHKELVFFQKHFMKRYPGVWKKVDLEAFEKDIKNLCHFLSEESKYFTHRDYHSKNFMIKKNEFIVIDFQDARLGSPAYDLVSLCFDAYVPMTTDLRCSLIEDGINRISKRFDLKEATTRIRATWKDVLLQRQLKAVGSFCYLSQEKKSSSYHESILPALNTLVEVNPYNPRWPYLSQDLLTQLREGISHAS